MTTSFPTRVVTGGLLLAALVLTTVGCGPAKKEPASVSGTVKYHGKPLATGSVNFISSATGSAGQGLLDENGNYKIDGLEAGSEYKVYLSPPVPGQFAPGTKAPKEPAKFDVLPKYQQPDSSGLKVSLKPGPNDFPIDIKE